MSDVKQQIGQAEFTEKLRIFDTSFNNVADLAKEFGRCCLRSETHEIIAAAEILIAWAKSDQQDNAANGIKKALSMVETGMGMQGFPCVPSQYPSAIGTPLDRERRPSNDWVKEELED